MADVFISYSRADRPVAERFAAALAAKGLSHWMDNQLTGGSTFTEVTEAELHSSRKVLVLWSQASIKSGWVKDEAQLGREQGKLVPLSIDGSLPPLGFRQIQTIDVADWLRGSAKDLPDEVLHALLAEPGDAHPPAPQGTDRQMRRRRVAGMLGAMGLVVLAVFGFDLFGAQRGVCSAGSTISDTCGSLGLGDRPTQAERISWESRTPGNCEDVRAHLRRFPDGRYQVRADALLSAASFETTQEFAPVSETRPGYARQGATPKASRAAALAALESRALEDARQVACAPADASERLLEVDVRDLVPDCRAAGGGFLCSGNYTAVCNFERQVVTESCG